MEKDIYKINHKDLFTMGDSSSKTELPNKLIKFVCRVSKQKPLEKTEEFTIPKRSDTSSFLNFNILI